MKKLLLIAIVLPLFFSCSKKEGCHDRPAMNYDEMAVVDDGSCIYTHLAFYALSSEIDGVAIDHVDIYVDGTLIGNFSGSIANGAQVCGSTNIATYDTKGEHSVDWAATIHLQNSTKVYNSGTVDTEVNSSCKIVHALPAS